MDQLVECGLACRWVGTGASARRAPSGKEAARPSLTALLVVSITARVPNFDGRVTLYCAPDAEVWIVDLIT